MHSHHSSIDRAPAVLRGGAEGQPDAWGHASYTALAGAAGSGGLGMGRGVRFPVNVQQPHPKSNL